jgi:hypothetical protein
MPVQEFRLWDASEGGAKLSPAASAEFDPSQVPNVFYVYMSPDLDFQSRRQCQLVWRSKSQLGIQFIRAEPKAPKPPASGGKGSGPAAA